MQPVGDPAGLVVADIGVLPGEQQEMIARWVANGGVLVRFAGPRLAQADDDLVPVKLLTKVALKADGPTGVKTVDVTVMATDATKFNRPAPIRIAEPSAFSRLVTDAPPPARSPMPPARCRVRP